MEIINQVKGSSNPAQTFELLKQQNPLMKETQELINKYGNGNPKTAVHAMAREIGMKPEELLSMIGLK